MAPEVNASELKERLGGVAPKTILAGILIGGFLGTLPFWMMSTPEQKQRMLHETATLQVVENNVGFLDLQPDEEAQLRRMLKRPEIKDAIAVQPEQKAELESIKVLVQPRVPDALEAENIARWVYLYSRRFDLSPYLVLAVIAIESQFDHFAVSNVGALGLMQVMPFWKDKLGSKDDNLFAVETNIRYGCAILRMYLDRYGSLTRALAAYNGSLGNRRYPARIYAQMKRFKASRKKIGQG